MGTTASTQTGGNRIRTYSEQEILQNINSIFRKPANKNHDNDTLSTVKFDYNAVGGTTKPKTFESSKKRYLKYDLNKFINQENIHTGGSNLVNLNDQATIPSFDPGELNKITQFLSGQNKGTPQTDTESINKPKQMSLTNALRQIAQSGGAIDDSEDMHTMEDDLFDSSDADSNTESEQRRLIGFDYDVTSTDDLSESDSETSSHKDKEVAYDDYNANNEGNDMDIYAFYSSTDSEVTPHRNYY